MSIPFCSCVYVNCSIMEVQYNLRTCIFIHSVEIFEGVYSGSL